MSTRVSGLGCMVNSLVLGYGHSGRSLLIGGIMIGLSRCLRRKVRANSIFCSSRTENWPIPMCWR